MRTSVSNVSKSKTIPLQFLHINVEDDDSGMRILLELPEEYFFASDKISDLVENFIYDIKKEIPTTEKRDK